MALVPVGLAIWLFPLRFARALVHLGLYPDPTKSDDGAEKLAAAVEAWSFVGKLESLGLGMAAVGLVVLLVHFLRGSSVQQRVVHEHVERVETVIRSERPDLSRESALSRYKEVIPGATYEIEDDGEERIIPPPAKGR